MAARRRSNANAAPQATPPTTCISQLKQKYPGRAPQIDELATLLSAVSAGSPVFVYGPPGTGKTSVLRDLLSSLSTPHAYVNCHETTRHRGILEAILHQLKGAKRRRDEGYAASGRCDTMADFLTALPAVMSRQKGAAWILLDNAQRLAGSDLLSALTRLQDGASVNLGVVLMSPVPWDTGRFIGAAQNLLPPHPVLFPAYSLEQLQKILGARLPRETPASLDPAYRQFLQTAVPPLHRASNSVLDLRVAVDRLWPQYAAPLLAGQKLGSAALMARIRGDLQRAVSEMDMGGGAKAAAPSAALASAAATSQASAEPAASDQRVSRPDGLAFELPYVSKFLILAAYVASRNKPTTDRTVFDPGHSSRGRRNAQALDRQTEAATEAALRGPHSFPLERLLHIFYCIYEQHGDDEFDQEGGGGGGGGGGGDGGSSAAAAGRDAAANFSHKVQRAEVQMQLSTLVTLRLLSMSGGDVLEGATYRCNVSEIVALAIAANVKIRLGDYLKLA